jgi:hypothetical protein
VAATVLIANTATAASQLLAAWVFTAEAAAAAALIADDADGGDRGVAVVRGRGCDGGGEWGGDAEDGW